MLPQGISVYIDKSQKKLYIRFMQKQPMLAKEERKEIQWQAASDWMANKFKQGRFRRKEIDRYTDLRTCDNTTATVRCCLLS